MLNSGFMVKEKLPYCKECGKELSGRQTMFCSNLCKLKNKEAIAGRTKKKEAQDKSKLIKSKIDDSTFEDLNNYSGALTRHLAKNNIVTDDVFHYFDIIDNPDYGKPVYQCKYCDWATIDVENKSGWITLHLQRKHNILPSQHLQNYPDDNIFGTYRISPDMRDVILGKDENSYIECKECNVKFEKLTTRHLAMHGLTTDEYKVKHGVDILCSKKLSEWHQNHYKNNIEEINKNSFFSKAELELIAFLDEHHIPVLHKDRDLIYPNEVDILLPVHNIAIEYDGLYYHSEFSGKKTRQYHLNKTKQCEDKGITLIHIFEDEWTFKKDIVKQRLLHIAGKSEYKTYARKCTVKEITATVKNAFINRYHIQGEDKSKVNIGLYDERDELVSVMTFSSMRQALGHKNDNDKHFELSRFATKGNVIGAASKLMQFFIRNYQPKQIISYADRRWTSGIKETLYDKIGFKKVGETSPNYWYTKGYHKRSHRFNFTKHKIVSKLGGDAALTEVQNMVNMGWDRIWDCGSFKYQMCL
jgi:hypothetical protein